MERGLASEAHRKPPSGLLLEGERLPVGVADDEAGVRLFGDPRGS